MSDEIIKSLDKFCKTPKKENFREIREEIRKLLYSLSLEILSTEKGKGNREMAFKISKFHLGSFLTEEQKIGVRAFILCCKMLKQKEIKNLATKKRKEREKLEQKQKKKKEANRRSIFMNKTIEYPYAHILCESGVYMKLAFDSGVENMYSLLIYTKTGGDESLLLYYEHTVIEILEYFIENGDDKIIEISLRMDENKKYWNDFFDINIGIIWNKKKYTKCMKNLYQGKKSEKCIKLVEKEHKNIKYGLTQDQIDTLIKSRIPLTKRPEIQQEIEQTITPIDKSKPLVPLSSVFTENKWECPDCLLQNDGTQDICIACGYNRITKKSGIALLNPYKTKQEIEEETRQRREKRREQGLNSQSTEYDFKLESDEERE